MAMVILSTAVEGFNVSRMRDFYESWPHDSLDCPGTRDPLLLIYGVVLFKFSTFFWQWSINTKGHCSLLKYIHGKIDMSMINMIKPNI